LDGSKSLQKSGLLGNLGVGVGEEDIDDLFGVWRELALVQGKKFLSFLYIPIEIDKNLGKIDKLLRVWSAN
jgi:hypothetical protein